ncbi:hypothetical protein [Geodermatophilus amargosae]
MTTVGNGVLNGGYLLGVVARAALLDSTARVLSFTRRTPSARP